MNHRIPLLTVLLPLLAIASCAGPRSDTGGGETEVRPGFFSRALNVFRGDPGRIEEAGSSRAGSIAMRVRTVPETIDLDRVRRLAVEVTLTNESDEIVTLQFGTGQRLEILIRDSGDAVLTRWSDDRAFDQAVAHVSINPGERVVYKETISLRELRPGGEFTLDVFLPGHPELRVTRPLRPLPKSS